MPIALLDSGPVIQTQDQILAEMNSAFVGEFGSDFEIDDASFTYRQNAILATREAEIQSFLAATLRALDVDNSSGIVLDIAGVLLDTPRKGPTRSTISARLVGNPGTAVGDRRVRYLITGDLWRTPVGAEIGPDGTILVTLTAESTGPIFATAQATTAWAIVDVTTGWTSVESLGDAARGTNRELDPAYRTRLKNAKSNSRGTEPAVRRALGSTPGVTAFTYDNNRSPVINTNGVPGFHAEAIVEGGSDLDVATTLYTYQSGGAGFWGTTSVDVTDPTDGTVVEVKLSRIENLQVEGIFSLQLAGDSPLPVGATDTAIEAIADRINSNGSGIDVDPGDLIAVAALAFPPGTIEPDDSTGQVAFKGGGFQTDPLAISLRQNAFTITTPQPATIVGTVATDTFNLTAGESLVVAVDDGPLTVIAINTEDYAVISAATLTEIIAAFSLQAPTMLNIGSQSGALVLTSSSTGAAASITIDVSSSAGLLAALGLSAGVFTGSAPDIIVTFTGP